MNMVHTVKVNTKLFTEEDLQISKMYINPDVYPGFYDNSKLPKTFQYKGRMLIDLNEIGNALTAFKNLDKKINRNCFHGLTQDSLIRLMGRGINSDDVIANLNKFGYELNHIPISIAICPDGKLYSLDGRTRLEFLERAKFKNAIVDVYICTSWPEFFRQAISRNPPTIPRSPMTLGDIINHCNGAIELGWLKRDYNTIRDYVIEITDNRLKNEVMGKIIHNVLHGSGYSDKVASFTEKLAIEWLRTNGYHDNENNNGIYYKVVPASSWTKSIGSVADTLVDSLFAEGKTVKELRVIIHTGTLEGADPSKSWKGKIDKFRAGWKDNLKNIENSFFQVNKRKSIIKLYGAIPAVTDLSHEYPMDKLVMFHVGDLKDKSFAEIDTVNALELALAA